ncbi:hypothetical protein QZH41_012163 [Actinostola sp. cb2023]|nr:hypothetical protein QZH41_012163 [Actinostola sp. cb2023]
MKRDYPAARVLAGMIGAELSSLSGIIIIIITIITTIITTTTTMTATIIIIIITTIITTMTTTMTATIIIIITIITTIIDHYYYHHHHDSSTDAGELYLARVLSERAHANINRRPLVFQVFYAGQAIAAVVAETKDQAQRAAKMVKVTYEDLPVIITIQDAIVAQSFLAFSPSISKGDVTVGFKSADHVIEGEMYAGGQAHYYLETQTSLAVPGENNEMEVFCSTQFPTNVQTAVRCALDRTEDMINTGKREDYLIKYKVGFMNDGHIVALQADYYGNSGAAFDISPAVMEKCLLNLDNAYIIPNIHVTGKLCKTNIPPNTAMRGLASAQVSQTIREINFYKEGNKTHFNQVLQDCNIERVWHEMLQKSDYENRKLAIDTFNKQNRWTKRGVAVTPAKYGIGYTIAPLTQGGALVMVYTDGSVRVSHGGVELGQGLYTKMLQVAAKSLGIPVSKVFTSETSTDKVPNTSPSAASYSSDINGMAVKDACDKILQRLEPYKASNPNGTWEDWVLSAYLNHVNLSATGFYESGHFTYDWQTNTGQAFKYFSFGACCCEVEVDCLTGDHKIIRSDIVMDVGRSLNPAIDIGQIEGAFVQGCGMFTIEELCYSKEGHLLTNGPRTYKIPTLADIPKEFNVHILKNSRNKEAIHSSKAVGETCIVLAPVVFLALKDAITSASIALVAMVNSTSSGSSLNSFSRGYEDKVFPGVLKASQEPTSLPDAFFVRYTGQVVGCRYTGQVAGCRYTGQVAGCRYTGQVAGCRYMGQVAGCRYTGQVAGCRYTGQVVGCRYTGQVAGCRYTGQVAGCRYTGQVAGCRFTGQVAGCRYMGQVAGCQYTGQVAGCRYTGQVAGCRYTGQVAGCRYTGQVAGCRYTGQVAGCRYTGQVAGCRYMGQVAGCRYTGQVAGCRYMGQVAGCRYTGQVAGCRYMGQVAGCRYTGQVAGCRYMGQVAGCRYTGQVAGCRYTGQVAGWSRQKETFMRLKLDFLLNCVYRV